MWREKQRRVKKGEENVRVTMESGNENIGDTQQKNTALNNNWMSLKPELRRIETRHVWTEQAAIFINQVF